MGNTLQWCHNEHDGVSIHHPHHCLLIRLFRHRSKKISKLCVTGLCAKNSPVTGEFPAKCTGNAESVSIWWRHHDKLRLRTRDAKSQKPEPYHIEAGSKWPTFCRCCFQMHFLESKLLYFHWNLTEKSETRALSHWGWVKMANIL